MDEPLSRIRLEAAGIGAFFRPRDIEGLGVSFRQLQELVSKGIVEKYGNGLYRLVEVEPTEMESIAMVLSTAPHAIVCLLTALRVHELGTQSPNEVWIAIDRKARRPANLPTRTRIVRFSGAMLTVGVDRQRIQGVQASITSPARTVVDCFRYRNKVGLDVAMEALRDALRSRKATVDEIARIAKACRIGTVINPYLDALLA